MINRSNGFAALAAEAAFYLHGWGFTMGDVVPSELHSVLQMERSAVIEMYSILYDHGSIYGRCEPYLTSGWVSIANGMTLRGWVMGRIGRNGFELISET